MMTVLKPFSTQYRRFAAGMEIDDSDVPQGQRNGLVGAGYLAPLRDEPTGDLPDETPAEEWLPSDEEAPSEDDPPAEDPPPDPFVE